MTSESHHLLTLWNPSYAADAMDEHLAVLIDWASRAQAGDANRDDICSHLYLTDYRSLYVAWVGEITAEHLPREQPEELDPMASHYRDQFADFWFRLWDIRRLVADGSPQSGIRRRTAGPRPGTGWEKAGMRSWDRV